MKLLNLTVIIIAVAALTGYKVCKEKTYNTSQTAKLMDTDVTSTHFSDDVAAFNFSIQQTENAENECINSYKSVVSLTIVNLTNETISFSYVADYLGLASWNTTGTATLPPGGSIDKGVVSTVGTNYSAEYFHISSSNITYQ